MAAGLNFMMGAVNYIHMPHGAAKSTSRPRKDVPSPIQDKDAARAAMRRQVRSRSRSASPTTPKWLQSLNRPSVADRAKKHGYSINCFKAEKPHTPTSSSGLSQEMLDRMAVSDEDTQEDIVEVWVHSNPNFQRDVSSELHYSSLLSL
mmetsp:Transcript_58012/g.138104  ORF Transcript_58012/g.138104 Transcript_58012/m.138104 type:complete len:148 (+) Transcript_58012:110-553(+)|eukprot:CAMPEP_0178395986 /NCGR_PEP_ID=MMETSP0689_2-20121128/13500_1 /TAXON_ID=160604 /ORGANISM="Amphidinium massartii, Strain CS-259" /LENGTH=147 /DNA_ID=CAMNT_0020016655 /DNA_START=23 /DNA_END=466 /DNA_ORIENTATION=+